MTKLPSPHAVAGIRVSTDQQQDKYGPARQRKDIEREADRASLKIIDWVEEAVSGADDERAHENRYYELARQHQGLNVIFSHPNRVGRHIEVTVGIARKIHKLGGTVYIAGIGSLRDKRNWREFLRDAVDAETEYSNLIYNLKNGKYEKAAQENHWPQGKPPYGYRLIRLENGRSTTLEPHPEQAPIYALMLDMALQDHGAHTIAKHLNENGVPEPRQGGRRKSAGWSAIQVARILKNPRALGYADHIGPEGQTTRITYPPLITPAQYAQVQAGFERRKKHRPARTAYPNLLGGHLRCAACGSSLNVQANRDRKGVRRWAYYKCNQASRGAERKARRQPLCTQNVYHAQPDLDRVAWAAFVEAVTSPAFIAQALAAPPPTIDHGPRLAEIDQEMAAIITQAVRFALPDSAVQASLGPLKAERAKLLVAMQPVAPPPRHDAYELAAAYAERLAGVETLEQKKAALALWQAQFYVDASGITELKITLALS